MFTVWIIIFLFSLTSLYADLLEFKTGQALEGTFISEKGNFVQFEVGGKLQNIPKYNIKSLELGYTGTSFCFKQVEQEENCDSVLHSFDDRKIVIGKGKGSIVKEEIALGNLEYFHSKNIRKKDRVAGIVKPKAQLEIVSSKGGLKGKVTGNDFVKGVIQFEPEGKTEILEIKDEEVTELHWKADLPFQWKKYPPMAIPGFYQFPHNKWKAGTMFFLFLAFGAAIPVEYGNAQKALNNDQDIIYYNNTVYFLSGLGSNPAFETHKRNMNIAIGGLTALMTYHVIDVYITEKNSKGNQTSIQLQMTPPLWFHRDSLLLESQREMNIGLKFSYSF